MSDNQINIEIRAQDKATPTFQSIIKALKGVEIAADGGAEKMTKFSRTFTKGELGILSEGFSDLGGAMAKTFEVMRDGYAYVRRLDRGLDELREGANLIGKPAQMMAKYQSAVTSVLAPTKSLGLATQSLVARTTGIAGNDTLARMSAYYGRLERAGEATERVSGKSRVLTTTVGKLIDEQMGFKKSIEQTDLANHIRELDRAAREEAKLADETKGVATETKKVAPALRSASRAAKVAESGIDRWVKHADAGAQHITRVFTSVGRVIRRSVLVGTGAAAASMALLTRTGLQYNGQMQTYQVMMTTYLKDARQANQLIVEAQRFAMRTPLDTTQVMKTATMLIQYGSSAKESMKITKQLADVSAGSTEKMNLLGIAFSQIAAKGKLQAEEVRQLTNAGYNPLKTISAQTGKSMGDLYKEMKAGKITFDMVQKALEKDTKAGGKFHGNVMALSKTLPGATANIKEMSKALIGHAYQGTYKWLTKVAVATQTYMSILTDGILLGKGWKRSLDNMTAAMRKTGGVAASAADTIDRINNSSFAGFIRNFKRDVKAELAKGATFKVAVRRSLEKSDTGSTMVGLFDGAKNTLKALGPIVKGALNFLGPFIAEVGKRIVKLLGSFREMAPLFTNVIGPLLKGVFRGILSVIDPIIAAIGWLAPWIGKLGTSMKPFSKYFEKVGYVVGMLFGGPILAGIGKFTKGFGIVGKAVAPLGKGLWAVAGVIGKMVGSVALFVGKFLGGVVRIGISVAQFFGKFTGGFLRIITWPARLYLKFVWAVAKMGAKFIGALPKMKDKFFGFVGELGGKLGMLVRGFVWKMAKALQGIRDKFGSFAKFIGTAIGHGVIAIINGVIKQINKLFDGVEKIINKIPGVDVNMPTIGTIGGGGSSGGGGDPGSVTSIRPATPVPSGTLGSGNQFDPFARSRDANGDIVVKIDGREVGRASGRQVVKKAARA